ncbi:tRNA (adenosine(37)-N6)-threonylcarbamoyltransferase complex ATPase subunit type 1 TsaE [Candidatus Saccharibacteria bacterium]|nr:tRNA (adenosine(37)-N6)-threonylcarbamoyltransferase complex ATPase subunit type 1 TsaE [Candidatus Saccharibacteria bacterium]
MIFNSEQELSDFAERLGKSLKPPLVFELIGDVGAGKTTFTRALAKGLGIKTPVTSPTFSISNRYYSKEKSLELIHYDFYRLSDPGLMSFELSEALADKNAIIVIEWGDFIKDLLPKNHPTVSFKIISDTTRELTLSNL